MGLQTNYITLNLDNIIFILILIMESERIGTEGNGTEGNEN